MLKVLVLLQLAVVTTYDDLRTTRRDERGSVTTEHVLWAVAVIAIVGLLASLVLGGVHNAHARAKDRVWRVEAPDLFLSSKTG